MALATWDSGNTKNTFSKSLLDKSIVLVKAALFLSTVSLRAIRHLKIAELFLFAFSGCEKLARTSGLRDP